MAKTDQCEATSHVANTKAHKHLHERLAKQYPPIDLEKPASNTTQVEPHERNEKEW